MIQQTSLEAFYEMQPQLGKRQKEVLWAIDQLKECTDYEITHFLGKKDPNSTRPRRFELVNAGLIHCSGKRQCKITKKTAMVWKTT